VSGQHSNPVQVGQVVEACNPPRRFATKHCHPHDTQQCKAKGPCKAMRKADYDTQNLSWIQTFDGNWLPLSVTWPTEGGERVAFERLHPTQTDPRDLINNSSLHYLARAGPSHHPMLALLLKNALPVTAPPNEQVPRTPTPIAVEDLWIALLARNTAGLTPLMVAAAVGNLATVKMLVTAEQQLLERRPDLSAWVRQFAAPLCSHHCAICCSFSTTCRLSTRADRLLTVLCLRISPPNSYQ